MTAENDSRSDKDRLNIDENKSQLAKVTASYRSGWAYAEVAVQYGLSIVICALIGYWLDNKFETGNTWMIVGVVCGTVFGFIGLLKTLTRKQKKGAGKENDKT